MSITILKPSRRKGVRLNNVSDRSLGFVPAKRVKTAADVQLRISPRIRVKAPRLNEFTPPPAYRFEK